MYGRRHNNDHAEVVRMELLPTVEEITSTRSEYMPTRDPFLRHLAGVQGLLDQHFRLLREDLAGPLRDGIRAELDRGRRRIQPPSRTHVFTYTNLKVVDSTFSTWRGLEFTIRVDQPRHLRHQRPQIRRDWWMASKRLQIGALVCIPQSGWLSHLLHCVGTRHWWRVTMGTEAWWWESRTGLSTHDRAFEHLG